MYSIPSGVPPSTLDSSNGAAAPFNSPLKKRPLHELIPDNLEKLKEEHLARAPKRRRIPGPLFIINDRDARQVPEKLKPAVQAIEEYIPNLGHIVAAEAQVLIESIIDSERFSTEEKEIELGLLYFYLTAHKNLPQELPLLSARLEEIEGEVLLLQQEHERVCPDNKAIPSGSRHYIQRAFFHMIFTDNGAFNVGGSLAVKKLLTASRLNLLLTEEERHRILSTVTLLIEDEEFKDLFMQPLTPHPTLKKVISLDMKKPSKEPLSAVEIRRALLMQFFSLIGQWDEGNCYALASYLNLMNEHPKVLLEMTIELLKEGKLYFEGVEIPIYLLMGNRLQWEKDFKYEFNPDAAFRLTPLAVAQNALGIRISQKFKPTTDRPLSQLMTQAFGPATEEAKQLFAAHKFNMVQQMMLSVLQFIAKNTSVHSEGRETPKVEMFRHLRALYRDDLHTQLQLAGIEKDDEIDSLFARIDAQFYKKMYWVDMRNWTHFTRGDRIIFENHAVGLKIKEEDLKGNPFKFMTRLYMHKEGNFLPIERISEFSSCMCECVEEAIGNNPSEKVLKAASIFKYFLSSFDFEFITSKWLRSENRTADNNLGLDVYLDSDSFFLNALGSYETFITDFGHLYAAYAPPLKFKSTSIADFFHNLCSLVREIVKCDPSYRKGSDHKIIMSYSLHIFNLTIDTFSSYWQSQDDILDERVVTPAKNLLLASISKKRKARALTLFGGKRAQATYASLVSRPLSAKEFKDRMLAQIPAEKQAHFKESFNQAVQEIPYRKLISQAANLTRKLSRSLTKEEEAQVAHYIEKKQKKRSYLSPYQSAKLLKKALLTLENSIDLPIYRLEQSIRELFNLPEVVPIANLNWVEHQSEHLKYDTLVINCNLADEEIIISSRSRGIESPFVDTSALIEKTYLVYNRPPAAAGEKI